MENRRSENDEMSRGMWEKVKDRKTDETGVEEVGRKRRERKEKANDKREKNDSKNCGRKEI